MPYAPRFDPRVMPGDDNLRAWFSPSSFEGVNNKDRYDTAEPWLTVGGGSFPSATAPTWTAGGFTVQNGFLFNGTSDGLMRLVPPDIIGDDVPFTLLFAAQVVGSLLLPNPLVSLCGGSSVNAAMVVSANAAGAWNVSKRGDGSDTTTSVTGGSADNDPHIFAMVHTGTSTSLYVDATTVINNAAQNKLPCNPSHIVLGMFSATGAPTEVYGNVMIGDVCAYAGALSNPTLGYLRRAMRNAYAL